MPNPELGVSPGWLPIEDGRAHLHQRVPAPQGYWTAQVSDNPFLAFTKAFEPFRQTFDRWDTIVGQSGFVQAAGDVSRSRRVYHWLPPALRDERYIPGMRKYLANTGERRGRGGDLRRARLQEGARHARPGPSCASRSA